MPLSVVHLDEKTASRRSALSRLRAIRRLTRFMGLGDHGGLCRCRIGSRVATIRSEPAVR